VGVAQTFLSVRESLAAASKRAGYTKSGSYVSNGGANSQLAIVRRRSGWRFLQGILLLRARKPPTTAVLLSGPPQVFDHVGLLANEPSNQADWSYPSSRRPTKSHAVPTHTISIYCPVSIYMISLGVGHASGFVPFLLMVAHAVRYFTPELLSIHGFSSGRDGPAPIGGFPLEFVMKTQGEIEAAICKGMIHFEQNYMGRGPKDVHAHLIGDLLLVRLQGVLTGAEQQLVKSLSSDKGRDLLKEVRSQLMETARSIMETMVHEATGVNVVSLHHDISTKTGEEVVLFTLSQAPSFRETKQK
jgi:uncharacterized protein YbcI